MASSMNNERSRAMHSNYRHRAEIRCQHHSSLRRPRHRPGGYSSSIFVSALLSLALSSFSPSSSLRTASAARAPRPVSGSSSVNINSTATATAAKDDSKPLKVTAYYGPHRYHDRSGLSKPEYLDYTKVTRINYGPFQINEQGSIWGTDVNADPKLLFGPPDWNPPPDATKYCHQTAPDIQPQCGYHHYDRGLVSMAHANDVEVYVSIGGKDWSEKFSDMASNQDTRLKFASNAASLVVGYDLDGLDIAWQFPKSAEDMANHRSLLFRVRLELDYMGNVHNRTYGLTATLPCNHDSLEYIDIPTLDSILTEYNLLSFDFQGPWEGRVGVNSALYDIEGNSIDGCVTNYLEGGASREKINAGLAFYGHSFRGAKDIGDHCDRNWAGVCSDTDSWQEDNGSPQYHNIYNILPDMTLSFDLQSMTPLAYNDRSVVSFDDPHSICLKTGYAHTNELNGLVIMDLAADMLNDRSMPLLDAANLKIREPSINCRGETFKQLFEWREVASFNPYGNNGVGKQNSKSNEEDGGPTHRYTCGNGEGDAIERCNSEDWEDVGCEHGFCPSNMGCYVVLCSKNRGKKPSFSKSKPRRKKPHAASAEKGSLPVAGRMREKQQAADPEGKIPALQQIKMQLETASGPNYSFSCGSHFEHAQECSHPCPNGLTDCPSGQFCFWLECDTDAPTSAPIQSVVASSTETVTEIKYQCGRSREEALTCANDCGFAWQCPFGYDCYSVPCPS